MPRPEMGKTYLFVFCKSCDKGFRVIDDALFDGKEIQIKLEPHTLKCRGCGHVATYLPQEMRTGHLGTKEEARKRKADAQRN